MKKTSSSVKGVELEGIILHRTAPDIVVEITSPHQELLGKSRIAYFSLSHISFIGAYGDKRALALLEVLDMCSRFLYGNLEFLRRRWAELQELLQTEAGRYTQDDFLGDRKAARARHRAAETTDQEFGRTVKEFTLRESKSSDTEHCATPAFFCAHRSGKVPRLVVEIPEVLSAPSPATV
jgi:hypothetical protein